MSVSRWLALPAACLAALLALTLAVACGDGAGDDGGGGGDGDDSGLPTATIALLTGGGERVELTAELARSDEEQNRGLMFREALAEDRGMLFVYPGDVERGFWMRDTPLPLSIAFISPDGTIIEIEDMEPLSTDRHSSPQPYRYALEVNQGWFEENGLKAGDRMEIPADVSATAEP
jgi:uncharacterized membrane protein (UPF0127 family)